MLESSHLESILDRIQEWTRAADQKVSIAVLMETAFAALYLPSLPPWFTNDYLAGYRLWISLATVLWLASVVAAGMALLARTKNPHHEAVTFFGDIAQMDLGLYRDKIQSMSSTDLYAEFIEQIHTCAVICGNKHFWARWTLLLFFGSLGILLAAYVRLGLG